MTILQWFVILAGQHPAGKLFPEALCVDRRCGRGAIPYAPVCHFVRDKFRSDERIVRGAVPLPVMHGGRDSTISIAFGERLFALAGEPKQFVRFPEGGHDNLDQHGAIETVRRFIG